MFLWGQDFSIMLGNEIRTRRNDYTIFDLLTCSSNRTSLNLEHSPVFFEHPVYTRSPSLRKCGSFDWEIISSSSWRGTGTRDLEWRRVRERNYFTPCISPTTRPVKHISQRTNTRNYRAQSYALPSPVVEIVLVYNRYTRNWNNTFLTANCRTITLQSGIKAVVHTHTHARTHIYTSRRRELLNWISFHEFVSIGSSWKMIANRSSRVCIYTGLCGIGLLKVGEKLLLAQKSADEIGG